ncbi:hypothetical protein Tco_0186535 [Tanacetum coccineum]
MLWLSLHVTLHFSSLQMFQKSTCINFGILFTSMTLSTDSKWTKGRDSNSIWKSSEISSRSSLESLSGKITGLDKLRLSRAQILCGMYHQKNVNYVELLWEDFIYQIDNKANKKQEKMYYPRFTKVIIHHFLTQDKTIFWRNKIGMHTSKDDYLINTLRFVSAKEETQIYGAILPESLTSPEIKESKAYKTYLVSTEEPTGKSKRVKRPAKKSTKAPTRGVVIRETPEMPLSKKKEKTHPSGSGAVKIIPSVTSEGTDNENESDSEHETDENESGLESDQEENEEEVKDELVKTPSNDSSNEDETKITDKAEGDEDEEIDYTTSQLYDDVDIRLNEPVDTDKEFVQEEGTDAAMTNVQQGNENSEIVQVIEDAHVTLSTVLQKTEVPFTSSSHSSDLAAKFLNFSDISHMDAEIVSLMDVHVYHEVPSKQTPTLLIVPILVITDSSLVFSIVILQSLPSFTPPPQ